METCNFGGFFEKKSWFLLTGMPVFLLLPPENEILQNFWIINADNNEEFTIKHWEKKIMWSLWKVFLVFFASISPDIMVIWT